MILQTLKNSINRTVQKKFTPPAGSIRFGDFRRLQPFSSTFGFNRGLPVDRYFIEAFLSKHENDIKGHVMEIKDDAYTQKFGGNKVTSCDIVDIDADNPHATLIADLAKADHIPSNSYDCIVLTQTLLLIYDVKAAIEHCYRILKPGGVLLITVPGIVQMDYKSLGHTWHWSFTMASSKALMLECFKEQNVEVDYHGNVLVAASQLYGLSSSELQPEELNYKDPSYQMLITVRAVK